MSAVASADGPSRPLHITGIVLAAVLLTGLFAYLRFPYDRLAEAITSRLESDAGLRVQIGHLSARPMLGGPGLLAENVRITRPDGSVVDIDQLRVRPAWSFAWLLARPALHLEAETPVGAIDGTLVMRGPRQFSGEISEVDLKEVLGAEGLAGAQFEGRAHLDVDVAFEEAGPSGPIQITGSNGVLTHPQLPMAVPFEELNGQLMLGGDAWLTIQSLDLRSPLGNGALTGTIGHAADRSQAPLELDLAIQVSPEIRGSLASQGIRIGRDGQLHYQVSGTASAPIVR